MMKLIKFLIVGMVFCFRIYLIYNIVFTLHKFYDNKINVLNELGWYIGAIILDIYFLSLENSINSNIYIKKSDGEETS